MKETKSRDRIDIRKYSKRGRSQEQRQDQFRNKTKINTEMALGSKGQKLPHIANTMVDIILQMS